MKTTLNLATSYCWMLLLLSAIMGMSCKEKGVKNLKPDNSPPLSSGFVSLFNGNNLEGWEGDLNIWRVENGLLIGELDEDTDLNSNTFLIWKGGEPSNFDLKLEFRISSSGNSGINYRSDRVDSIPFALRGYQADIDGKNTYTGQNYEERKRTTLAYRGEKMAITTQVNPSLSGSLRSNIKHNAWQSRELLEDLGDLDSLKNKIHKEGWNTFRVVAHGYSLQHYVNGILMSEVIDRDTINRKASGHLGLQVHVGPPMKVAYRNIQLKEL